MSAAWEGEAVGGQRRWRGLPVPARDAVVAVLVAVLALQIPPVHPEADTGWIPHTVVLLACAPLVLRRRFPVSVAVVTGALVFLAFAAVGHDGSLLAAMVAVATAAHRRPGAAPPLAVASVAWWYAYQVVLFPGANSLVEWSGDPSAPAVSVIGDGLDFTLWALPALMPVLAGYVWRLRTDRAAGIRRAVRDSFERERLRERDRLAREVHDVAGHHLSAIRLLAVGGRQALEGRDPEAEAVLGSVAELSGRAVREVRELLDALREDRLSGAVPGTGFADLPSLTAALEGTGVLVELVMPVGVGDGLSERVGADVYRIVQESLGNVLRHASARRVRVRLTRSADALTVTVEDDGRRVPVGAEGDGGIGLAGMRQRAEELGGVLEAGRMPGRGWRVRAVLPVGGASGGAGAVEETQAGEGTG
ncbi:histidine kinase [Nocardiopsis sp. L17-MgMaSL7]|uniref:sensor histidine kinase n=1 Tax=Nocardiopsis sp. L17-MgMaSL7 TaxID=1938893 RepID=UPI000D71037D|nr:histidine kinase [Nocardiopsis sp. L17-MgMaSL7]PWV51284.1 signal transduction histidine kinase [Nocardiopsis sp. L17-MgMaSL7]